MSFPTLPQRPHAAVQCNFTSVLYTDISPLRTSVNHRKTENSDKPNIFSYVVGKQKRKLIKRVSGDFLCKILLSD